MLNVDIGGVVGKLGNGIKSVAEVFTPNATVKMEKDYKMFSDQLNYSKNLVRPWLYNIAVFPFIFVIYQLVFTPYLIEFGWVDPDFYELVKGSVNILTITFIYTVIASVIGVRNLQKRKQNEVIKEINKTIIAKKKEIKEKDDRNEIEKNRINFAFIDREEGGVLTEGYVVRVGVGKKVDANSGVTVGGGIDLAHTNLEPLREINHKLFSRLYMYKGRVGEHAESLLKAHPLKLSKDEAEMLTEMVRQEFVDKIKKEFSDEGKSFFHYPSEAQTVVFSRAWHGGWDLSRLCPKFFGYICEQDWVEAVKELRNFFSDKKQMRQFKKRLNREADLLSNIYKTRA